MNSIFDQKSSANYLFALLGCSGAGKTTILRYLRRSIAADAAPKFTTRPSRNTSEDIEDFIFCVDPNFPTDDIISFESYGYVFGIQRLEIDHSLKRGKSHVVVVGDASVVERLRDVYNEKVVSIFVFCQSSVLQKRVACDPARAARWPMISAEIDRVYDQLGSVDFVVNNSNSKEKTFSQINRVCKLLGQTGRADTAGSVG